MFVIILLFILIIIYLSKNIIFNKDDFTQFKEYPYPYNPQIQTPQSNYNQIISQINSQQKYKSNLSVSLAPTPTINCPELKNISDCNKYGCNWFGTFCSSTYPTQV
jgi:hypothetical protein